MIRVQVHANMIIAIQDPQYFFDIGYILKDTDVDTIGKKLKIPTWKHLYR